MLACVLWTTDIVVFFLLRVFGLALAFDFPFALAVGFVETLRAMPFACTPLAILPLFMGPFKFCCTCRIIHCGTSSFWTIRRGNVNKSSQLALSGVWWFWKFGSGQRCHHRIQKWSFHVFMIFLDFLQDFHTKYWILQKSWRKPKKYKKLRNQRRRFGHKTLGSPRPRWRPLDQIVDPGFGRRRLRPRCRRNCPHFDIILHYQCRDPKTRTCICLRPRGCHNHVEPTHSGERVRDRRLAWCSSLLGGW